MKSSVYIAVNGEIISADSPVISIQNRGFRYGDAIFETIRIAMGKIQFLNEHIKRLKYGMNILKMNIPTDYTVDYFEREILKLANRNKIGEGGRVRLTVFRNEGGYYAPSNNDVSYIIEVTPLNEVGYSLNLNGFTIDVYTEVTKPLNKLSNLKTTNCLCYILAGIYKTENMLDDCLVLNDKGSIAEAISSNIFVVKNGDLYTPSLDEGCVAGIMRGQIISLAKTNGLKVNQCSISEDDLLIAEEIILTNAINGIRWVQAYKQKKYISNTSVRLSKELTTFVRGQFKEGCSGKLANMA